MCKSPKEPGGPYRCSAHMKAALEGSKARYAKAMEATARQRTALEEVEERIEDAQYILDTQGANAPRRLVQDIEGFRASYSKLETELKKAEKHEEMWRLRMKEAIKNYDATMGGMQDLSQEINQLSGHLRDNPEDKEAYNRRRTLYARAMVAEKKLSSERQLSTGAAPDERYYQTLFNIPEHHDSTLPETAQHPVARIGDESDELIHPELDAVLDQIIIDEDLGAIAKTSDYLDTETGIEMSKHEIRTISARKRKEARAVVSRQKIADGDKKELMKVFLRQAIYRGLRYNRHSRRIIRIIGITQFNNFVDKMEDVYDLSREKKMQRKVDRWRNNRSKILAEEEAHYLKEKEDVEYGLDAKLASIDRKIGQHRISREDAKALRASVKQEANEHLASIQTELNKLYAEKAKWAEEDARREELRRHQAAQMQEEIQARRERLDKAEQAEKDALSWGVL